MGASSRDDTGMSMEAGGAGKEGSEDVEVRRDDWGNSVT